MMGCGRRREAAAGHEEGELDLEEGEALGGAARGTAHDELLDPDSLTYIDENLHNLLGHFQKDFEGGVLAENLGSQYGGYGSFLPTYQRSPSGVSQSRSPAVPPNRGSASRSPYIPVESAEKSHFFKTALDSRRKDDCCQGTSSGTNGTGHQQKLNTTTKGPEQKAPKIRIKVNTNRSLARNTAAIYSGLGLDISPSSSMDDSLDGSTGAPEPENLRNESPNTIFQIMTCHPIPGGVLLSPLAENILELRKRPKSVTNKHEAPALVDDKAEFNRDWCHVTSVARGNKDQMVNTYKYDEKKDHVPNVKSSKRRHNNSMIMNKMTMPELLDILDDTDSVLVPRSIKTEQASVEESTKLVADISNNHLKEIKNDPLKRRIRNKSSVGDIESIVDVGAVNLADDGNHPKGKANSKASTVRNAFKDLSKDSKTEPTLHEGFISKIKYDSDGYSDRPSTTSSQPQNVSRNNPSVGRDKGKVVHVKDELSLYRRKGMESSVNAESMDTIPESVGGNPSGMPKRKKKISSLQTAPSGKKLKVKAQKQLSNVTMKSYGEDMSVKPKETVSPGETDNGRLGDGNDDDHKISPLNFDRSTPVPSACVNEATKSSVSVPAAEPVVINERWACCDKCDKWRLLPYGMNPDILPKKWRCSMQSWLPAMSSCKISEDETTKALRALYMVPAPENDISLDGRHDISTSGICTAMAPLSSEGDTKFITTSGTPKVGSNVNVPSKLNMAEMSKPSKKLHSLISRNPDVDCFPKQKEKRKHVGSSDKGETVAEDLTRPESKSGIGVNHGNLRASKKIKEFNEAAKNCPSEFEISKSSPSIKETPIFLHQDSGISPSLGKYGSSSSVKCNDDKVISDEGIRTSDAGQSDLPDSSSKVRKSKQRQLSKPGTETGSSDASVKHIVKEAISESNGAKEKPMPELKSLKTDDSKVAHARGPIVGRDSDRMYAEKECLSEQHQENIHLQHSLLSESATRKSMCYAQASTAATSSSSKVSSSHKSKVDFQETRASPVESVSSSPLRASGKNIVDQNKRYPRAVAENVPSQEPGRSVSSFSTGTQDLGSGSDHAKLHGSGCFNGDRHRHVLKGGELQKVKQDLLTNECSENEDSGLGGRNGQLNSVIARKVNSHVLSMHGNCDEKQPPAREHGRTLPHLNSNQCDHAKLTSGKLPAQVKPDKGHAEQKDLKTNPSAVNGSKQQTTLNNTANGDVSSKAKQSKNTVIENTKQVALNRDASNPINTSVLLKEARDLKHWSKRLKEKGDDLESASICFEACLKFLHVASLLEGPSIDRSKEGDSIQAMRLYSETGNLCGFCAREFERLKKMANAALAYKCVEVAYMKAAFYKHPGAIKDKHALQATSLMVPPAESPSSSASDVDNLNYQSTAAKAVSARALYSPQIAGNPIPRNNHHLMGLLAYADDINYAFDGTRKSQSSFAAYVADIGKVQVDGIALVREVLEFSFHNVKRLLQLIRQSLESINHECVK